MAQRRLYCAECGRELLSFPKAIPAQERVVELIKPHTCSDNTKTDLFDGLEKSISKPLKKPGNLDAIFNSFKSVKKLNDLTPTTELIIPAAEPGDRRPKEHIKESTAPEGVRNMLKSLPISTPSSTMEELPNE